MRLGAFCAALGVLCGALCVLCVSCGTPGPEVRPMEGDFAFLERLLRNLYGSTPQIDLDKKIARSRAATPQAFDFHKLGDGMKRANVDLMGITMQVSAELKGGKAIFQPSGQDFPLEGPVPDAPAARRTFKVLDWKDPAKTRVLILP